MEIEDVIKSCNLQHENATHEASRMDDEIPKMEQDSKLGDTAEVNRFYQADEINSVFPR